MIDTFPSAKEYKSAIEELEEFIGVDTSGYSRESRIVVGEFEDAVSALKNILETYIEKGRCDTPRFFIGGDPSKNFRFEIATIKGYKSTRSTEKPVHFKSLRKWAMDNLNPAVSDGVECDDLVSIELYKDYLKGSKNPDNCECVLIAVDKDSKVTPGWMINPDKDDVPVWVTCQAARHWLYTQGIGGDACDAIKGVPGYGYKKADKILQDCETDEDYWYTTVKAYEKGWRAYCAKKKAKGEGYFITKDQKLSYLDKNGDRRVATFEDIADENLRLVYMCRTNEADRYRRP